MKDNTFANVPVQYGPILKASKAMGFTMPSDMPTGCLIRTLVASKPSARILELGTGTGLATSWILAGMDANSQLVTIDNDETLVSVAKQYLADDRIKFVIQDGYQWLSSKEEENFDVIFADAMPGKYELFENAWMMLKENGFYVVDDLLPQANWPEGHAKKVEEFIAMLENKKDTVFTKMNWSTGIIIVTRQSRLN